MALLLSKSPCDDLGFLDHEPIFNIQTHRAAVPVRHMQRDFHHALRQQSVNRPPEQLPAQSAPPALQQNNQIIDLAALQRNSARRIGAKQALTISAYAGISLSSSVRSTNSLSTLPPA